MCWGEISQHKNWNYRGSKKKSKRILKLEKNEMNSWINDKQNVLKMTMQNWTYNKNYDENLQNEK